MTDLPADERVRQWLRQVARDRASRVVDVPGGIGVLHDHFPAAYDHNRLLLWSPASPAAVAEAAAELLGGHDHRLVDVQGDGVFLEPLQDGGFVVSHDVVLELRSAPPLLPHVPVETLAPDERARVATADWHLEQPDWSDDVCRQLGDRVHTLAGAVDATFLAVRGVDGEVVARADLFVRDGIAQVEEVMTREEARGRGYASALLAEAVAIAHADLVFLIADADDWPQILYRRRGFVDQQVLTSFLVAPPPPS